MATASDNKSSTGATSGDGGGDYASAVSSDSATKPINFLFGTLPAATAAAGSAGSGGGSGGDEPDCGYDHPPIVPYHCNCCGFSTGIQKSELDRRAREDREAQLRFEAEQAKLAALASKMERFVLTKAAAAATATATATAATTGPAKPEATNSTNASAQTSAEVSVTTSAPAATAPK